MAFRLAVYSEKFDKACGILWMKCYFSVHKISVVGDACSMCKIRQMMQINVVDIWPQISWVRHQSRVKLALDAFDGLIVDGV